MTDIKTVIAKNIIELRKLKGLTQVGLADMLNYSDKAVSKWERGESVPDIVTLKQLADLFDVSVDYLISEVHDDPVAEKKKINKATVKNRGFITGLSILLVWLVATVIYVLISLILPQAQLVWLCFVYAVPVTFIVWLTLNSVWFNKRINFLIISLLVWSFIAAIYITLLTCGYNCWLLFIIGIPSEAIIIIWSRIRLNPVKTKKSNAAPSDNKS